MFSSILSVFLIIDSELHWWIVAGVGAAMGSYFFTALLHGEVFGIIMVSFQYLFMLPTFVNLFSAFSFCNMHDISWGTKEGNLSNEQKRAPVAENAMNAMKLIAHKRRRASMVMLEANAAHASALRLQASTGSPDASPMGYARGPEPRRAGSGRDLHSLYAAPGAIRSPTNFTVNNHRAGDGGAGGAGARAGRDDAMQNSLARRTELQDQINQLLNARTSDEGNAVLKSVDSSMGAVYAAARKRRANELKRKMEDGHESKASPEESSRRDAWRNGRDDDGHDRSGRMSTQGSRQSMNASVRHRRLPPKRRKKTERQVESEIAKEKKKVATTFAAFRTRFLGLWLVTNYLYACACCERYV